MLNGRTELTSMEQKLRKLKDELTLKERTWDDFCEREKHYCLQLTRFAQEIVTVNQLADNRLQDLLTMAQMLQVLSIFNLKKFKHIFN